MIFVFGSNLAGIHGAGAARHALVFERAVWGQGIGLQGNSYGIPTKDRQIMTLPLEAVSLHVHQFIAFADMSPLLDFKVTQIGCGLAGFTKEQIAPLFETAPKNCYFDRAWEPFLPNAYFWN